MLTLIFYQPSYGFTHSSLGLAWVKQIFKLLLRKIPVGKFKSYHGVTLVGQKYLVLYEFMVLREKCPNAELFLAHISRIQTEYRYLLCKYPYLVQMRECTDQKRLHILILFTQCSRGKAPFQKPVCLNIEIQVVGETG